MSCILSPIRILLETHYLMYFEKIMNSETINRVHDFILFLNLDLEYVHVFYFLPRTDLIHRVITEIYIINFCLLK